MRLRDEYGTPSPRARHVGIATGLLTVCAAGFAFGRMGAAPTPTPSPITQGTGPSASVVPASNPAPTAHTQAGAVTAATHADCVLGGPLVLNPARYRTALTALLAPDKVESAATIAQAESSQLDAQTGALTAAASGTRVYVTCVPLAFRIESSAPDSTAVSVWTEQVVAVEGSFAPASAYVTETLDMVWTDTGWKLESSQLLDTRWAPAPLESPLPQAGTLPAQMVNFTPLGGG